jgi:3-dehydroquinate synthase
VITVELKASTGNSSIYVGESVENIAKYVDPGKTIILTDDIVMSLYGQSFADYPHIVIGHGEKNKTFNSLTYIYEKLFELGADRKSTLVAVGGGLVSDVAGFAASTFLRGIRFGYAATTLLAQVDASVGGKTGINFGGFKNMIGVFRQPEFVLCDLAKLSSLPETEYLSGLGEVVKHSFIKSRELFDYISANIDKILARDMAVLERLVHECVLIKSGVVMRDEKENGERRLLNFGHTIGHAVESVTGMAHGLAVSAGMVAAINISVAKGSLNEAQADEAIALLKKLGLYAEIQADPGKLKKALFMDKKREGSSIHFVLLDGIGEAHYRSVEVSELEGIIDDLCGNS